MRAIIRDDEGRILLLHHHPETVNFPGEWDLPGGKCDPGETFWEALVREVQEESRFAIEIVSHVGSGQFENPHLTIIFLVLEVKVDHYDVRLSDEHTEFRWVRQDESGGPDICSPFRSFVPSESM